MISYRPARLSAQGEIIGESPTVVLEPETWVGRKFPLLKQIEILEDLSAGEWLVVFYHRDCLKCREALREYELFARSENEKGHKSQVALIEVPEKLSTPAQAGWARMACAQGRLSAECEWLIHTPIAVRVKDGRTMAIVNRAAELIAGKSTSFGG